MVVVTGGARSGKSGFALREAEAAARGGRLLFIATARAEDDEMRARIARHRRDRGDDVTTVEAPTEPARELSFAATVPPPGAVVLDCLTLWVSNLMADGLEDGVIEARADDLAARGQAALCPVYAVTNEVGMGIVPEHPLARRFRDLAGRVNQIVAARAQAVYFMCAGQALRIK
jgi:adenosylcobinamide kinase/adenosylcobinamide-phosphate guanylyltransferase